MKKLLCLVCLLPLSLFANFQKDNYQYRPKIDIGYSNYLATSLYGTKKVALTFDDGPTIGATENLLDVLKKNNVHATFFLIASKINATTAPLVKRMLDEGHTVGVHTYYHQDVNLETQEVFTLDAIKSISMIRSLATSFGYQKHTSYFRFPGGAYGARDDYHHLNVLRDISYQIFRENCINVVFWDIGVPDYCTTATPELIKDSLLANIFGGQSFTCQKDANGVFSIVVPTPVTKPVGGGIILMHDTYSGVAGMVDSLIREGSAQGMTFVSSLEEIPNYSYAGKSCRW